MRVKPIKLTDEPAYQTDAEKMEILRKKINEIVAVINEDSH